MSWSKEQVYVLIDLYKSHACLYATKHQLYKNKHAREEALETVKEGLKTLRPKTSVSEIKAKINALRQNFLTVHRKFISSKKSGASEEDIEIPNLWYYQELLFILEYCQPRKAKENFILDGDEVVYDELDEVNQLQNSLEHSEDMQNHDVEDVNEEIEIEERNTLVSKQVEASPSSSHTSSLIEEHAVQSLPSKRIMKSNKKDLLHESATTAMLQISNALKKKAEVQKKEHLDIFGEFVASNLKKMSEDVQKVVEAQICSIIYENL